MNCLDFAAYLKRIQYDRPVAADLGTLRSLHFHHATHIPFENLDIQLGIPISLDISALEEKLVLRKRGGYCFEQNHLFQAALLHAGYEVTACEARVRMGIKTFAPRTHMLLRVSLREGEFVADVGFGGEGLLYPVRIDGQPHAQFLWKYRVVQEDSSQILQSMHQDGWFDLYAFDISGCAPIDFEVANWYTSTHPKSRFVNTLTAQLPLSDARHIVRNRSYLVDRGDRQESREINSRAELLQLLDTVFGLPFPAETQFRNPPF